uniref:Protein kinase domain-containing protein n=1 Tax=Mycena chlorophos TaxID=658473 RepID=A0ABQ0L7S3_MYCCL|nr:predicted protein [Mycena chlorophos]
MPPKAAKTKSPPQPPTRYMGPRSVFPYFFVTPKLRAARKVPPSVELLPGSSAEKQPDDSLLTYIMDTMYGGSEGSMQEIQHGTLHIYVGPSAPLNIQTVHDFVKKAQHHLNGANLYGLFDLIQAPTLYVYFQPGDTDPQQLLLHSHMPKPPPSAIARGSTALAEVLGHSASRVHGVYPIAFDNNNPSKPVRLTLETAHCASHAESFAHMWKALNEISSLTDEKELSNRLAEYSMTLPRKSSEWELLTAAETFLRAQSQTYRNGEAGYRVQISGVLQQLLGLNEEHIAEFSTETNGSKTDIIFLVNNHLGIIVELKLATGTGDPAIQAVASVVSQARKHEPEKSSGKPIIVLTLAVRARSVVEIGHVLLRRYHDIDGVEKAAWLAAIDHTMPIAGPSTSAPSPLECFRVACVFARVGQTLQETRRLCEAAPTLAPVAPCVFPDRISPNGTKLTGALGPATLLRHGDMNVFRATWSPGDGTGPREVVIKMFPSTKYGIEAHQIAAKHNLAPELIFVGDLFESSGTGWSVCVMEYVPCTKIITKQHVDNLEKVPGRLQELGLVHGDFRLPNVLFTEAGDVKLADWNWASSPSTCSYYPHNINSKLQWPAGVSAGATLEPAHDLAQVGHIVASLNAEMSDGRVELAAVNQLPSTEGGILPAGPAFVPDDMDVDADDDDGEAE